jgi:hypothetical protein
MSNPSANPPALHVQDRQSLRQIRDSAIGK